MGRTKRPGTRHKAQGKTLLAAVAAFSLAAATSASTPQLHYPTYAIDIAPLIADRCTSCHQPDHVAPFSLLTYEDVRSRARLIAAVTKSRYMPPWKPVEGGPFANERRLTDKQIETIVRWVAAGAPQGESRAAIQSPNQPITQFTHPLSHSPTHQIPAADLIVTLPQPYLLAADGPDIFRNFVIPLPTRETKYVAAIDFRVNGSKAIHHANLRLDRSSSSRDLDAEDPLPGYEGPIGVHARYPEGYFLGWTPGQLPALAAKGMAWRLEPNTDLVVQLHLRKSGRVEEIRPSIAFFFTDEAPTRLPLALRLGRQNIDIAPGQTFTARDTYRLPVDVELHAIHPHAHYRATDIKAYAHLPDDTKRTLIHIDDWDFNWQEIYRYATPIVLPRGSLIVSEFTYDNSAGNPRNPDSPPRRVIFGQSSADEMGDLWLQVLPASTQDRARLYNDVYPKTLAEDVVGYEMLLRAKPHHAGYHSDVALLQARLGRRDEAIAHLRQATRLRPDYAAAHYNLGTLLATSGRMSEAAASYRAALAVRPNHAETHNNLGAVLKASGQLDEAIDHFKRAVALDPKNDEARANLAKALASQRN